MAPFVHYSIPDLTRLITSSVYSRQLFDFKYKSNVKRNGSHVHYSIPNSAGINGENTSRLITSAVSDAKNDSACLQGAELQCTCTSIAAK